VFLIMLTSVFAADTCVPWQPEPPTDPAPPAPPSLSAEVMSLQDACSSASGVSGRLVLVKRDTLPTGAECTLRGSDFRVTAEPGVRVATRIVLEDVSRVQVTGLTFAPGDGGDRVRVVGTSSDVMISDNVFPLVGSRTTLGRAVLVETDTSAARVAIVGNVVERVVSGREEPGDDPQAYAIQVRATTLSASVTDLLIARNDIGGVCGGLIDTGHSEAVALNGNISQFRVTQNHVARYVNIGIDVMGGEDQGPGQPHDGRLDHNLVERFERRDSSNDEPGFALYSDGAARLWFDHNVAWRVWDGFEASAERSIASGEIWFDASVVVGAGARGIRYGTWDHTGEASLVGVHGRRVEIVDAESPLEREAYLNTKVEDTCLEAEFYPNPPASISQISGQRGVISPDRAKALRSAKPCDIFGLLPDDDGVRPVGCKAP
jgi:hypothetical protein